MEQVFTCQVCGKVCKASNGLLAHHDYTRPFKGCQTNSCLGARYEPYEVSCERLKFAIDLYADMLDKRKVRFNEFKNNPPLILMERRMKTQESYDEITHMRPENFNMEDNHDSHSYGSEYMEFIFRIKHEIRDIDFELTVLQQRLANWKQPIEN